ncbi:MULTISPECIES: hypothetical protein [unclassified Nostoc]|jgi:hypothetical protein|uniref:hypothetical protein n=1 Tax=unclassified Nostoc TaxID=2593658 RepID=UPI000DEC9C2D|nr:MULTISPECIES: hypothetical protein [unclassified Nostoc]MBD2507241.1 hypothetical protein [Desmonostoc muscorum FACHB-395]QHG17766.1 hypothetical protein GJB62_18465 [Nostoc sp. ATCC 53789]QLE50515.1 hypothetical protein FD724_22075 [Nostoc sp. C057]RCJ26265.1 hypothetical protein A6V25_03025 [Nostoc sp. ATCC 53789]
MNTIFKERKIVSRLFAVLLSALLMVPLLSSCGGGSQKASVPPPVDDTVGRTVSDRTNQTEVKKGLGTGQKVALLAGAAALYYMYNQHKNAPQEGAQGKYYLSKNGRVYYRDAEHRAHWVTPPAEGIRVPESEAQKYREFQGYNRSATGRDLTGITSSAAPAL